MRLARAESGEAFALLVSNPGIGSPVSLDLKLIEADQVCTPLLRRGRNDEIDGIALDQWGNPSAYRVLKRHPGDSGVFRTPIDDLTAYDTFAASSVVHYFRADRPGQLRGIPDITPALPLFAQLRRYTLATIAAAETAANFAAVIYTDSPANGEADPLEPMDEVELEQRMATVLPGGWKLGQVHAEQPTTTFGEFKREILNEIARCLNMPFNVAAGNSSGYNYASGRLARLDNRLAVGVKRNRPNLLTRGCIHHADERLAARRELDHKHGFARSRVHGDGGVAFRPNRKRQRIAAACTRKRGHDHAVQLTLRREDDASLA